MPEVSIRITQLMSPKTTKQKAPGEVIAHTGWRPHRASSCGFNAKVHWAKARC